MKMKSGVLLVFAVALFALSAAIVGPAQAGRPIPPDRSPELYHFSTWTTGSIGVGVTVAPGGDALFNFAVVHEPNIRVECSLVVSAKKGRTTTTWADMAIGTYASCNDGLNLLAPLPSYYTWKNVSLPPGTYRWEIRAWDSQAKEWAHVSSTAYLTVTR